MDRETGKNYEAPAVEDYGDVRDHTEAQALTGPEDGGSKELVHHEAPTVPITP